MSTLVAHKPSAASTRDIYEIGEVPPIGVVPKHMYAQVIRAERFGDPTHAFKVEKIPVPELRPDEALVYVMAAGVNFNNVWAALGTPVNVIAARQKAKYDSSDFHIGGSDASGVVYAIGRDVRNVKVGDHVVMHCGQWDANCPAVRNGDDPMYDPSFKIWGYETNWGSFAQFTRVQAPSVYAQGEASYLGRSRRSHAGRRDCLSHADGMASAHRTP